jgi:hypothetical protein
MTQRSKQTEQITDAETTTNVENETEREIAKYLSEDTVDDGEWLQNNITMNDVRDRYQRHLCSRREQGSVTCARL